MSQSTDQEQLDQAVEMTVEVDLAESNYLSEIGDEFIPDESEKKASAYRPPSLAMAGNRRTRNGTSVISASGSVLGADYEFYKQRRQSNTIDAKSFIQGNFGGEQSAFAKDENKQNDMNISPSKVALHNDFLPSAKVKVMFGLKEGEEISLVNHKIICELQECYREHAHQTIGVWREKSRWVKFEEEYEEGGKRWSKPHVATLSLHSLFELRVLLMNGTIILDMDGVSNMSDIVNKTIKDMVYESEILPDTDPHLIKIIKNQLLAKHIHQEPLKHIDPTSEAANLLVGTMDDLPHPIMAFVRLKDAMIIDNLCEVDIPTKFLFILLGGPNFGNYYQIGRSFATLLSDEIFHEIIYRASTRDDLLIGLDEFLDMTTVLPRGEWDPRTRIEPPQNLQKDNVFRRLSMHPDEIIEDEPDCEHEIDEALQRTGKLFGGLIQDFYRKKPFYLSDFKDCLSLQCLSSFLFLYFAVITPVITFGGLWADQTNNQIAAIESLLGAAMSGFMYHLCCGQPLTIIGATGPILVFDSILFQICESFAIPFLPFRLWIGFWTALACIILVATDASYLVKYITRFTEESFSTLISTIFIISSVEKMIGVNSISQFWKGYDKNDVTFAEFTECKCEEPDWSLASLISQDHSGNARTVTRVNLKDLGRASGGPVKQYSESDFLFTDTTNSSNYFCHFDEKQKDVNF